MGHRCGCYHRDSRCLAVGGDDAPSAATAGGRRCWGRLNPTEGGLYLHAEYMCIHAVQHRHLQVRLSWSSMYMYSATLGRRKDFSDQSLHPTQERSCLSGFSWTNVSSHLHNSVL